MHRAGADPGFLKGGPILGLQAKQKGGVGPRGGPTVAPMLKNLHRGPKGGGEPPGHPRPWIRYCRVRLSVRACVRA